MIYLQNTHGKWQKIVQSWFIVTTNYTERAGFLVIGYMMPSYIPVLKSTSLITVNMKIYSFCCQSFNIFFIFIDFQKNN
jgi:hypothetical protein